MANFNLENYEPVKARKKRFYADYPDGRIIVEIQNSDVLEHALIKTSIYKTGDDQGKGLAFSTGYAHEIRDRELKKSQYGKEYESVNYSSWVENCEESSIGRALDNAGYSSNGKCSREEMQKVERVTNNSNDQTKEIERIKQTMPKDLQRKIKDIGLTGSQVITLVSVYKGNYDNISKAGEETNWEYKSMIDFA